MNPGRVHLIMLEHGMFRFLTEEDNSLLIIYDQVVVEGLHLQYWS